MSLKRRILIVGHDVTLAHLGRPLTLANAAIDDGWDVHLATSDRIDTIQHDFTGPLHRLTTVDPGRFARNLAQGRPVFSARELEAQLAEDIELISATDPALIVGDFRLTMGIASRLHGVGYANLTNAYWSPWAQNRFTVPDLPVLRHLPSALSQALFDLARPVAFAIHARPLRQLFVRIGIKNPPDSLQTAYTFGDVQLFSDLPSVYAGAQFPPSCRFIGPVQWAPKTVRPAWWNEALEHHPLAYVCMGSSGNQNVLAKVVEALAGMGVRSMVAGSPKALEHSPAKAWVEPFIDGAEAAAICDIVVCNGGSPSTYQALAAGKPVVGICGNLDQYLNMHHIGRAGAGLTLRSDSLSRHRLREAADLALNDPAIRRAAQKLQGEIETHEAGAAFTRFLRERFEDSTPS